MPGLDLFGDVLDRSGQRLQLLRIAGIVRDLQIEIEPANVLGVASADPISARPIGKALKREQAGAKHPHPFRIVRVGDREEGGKIHRPVLGDAVDLAQACGRAELLGLHVPIPDRRRRRGHCGRYSALAGRRWMLRAVMRHLECFLPFQP